MHHHRSTVIVALGALLWATSESGLLTIQSSVSAQVQSRDQRACINAMNAHAAKIGVQQGRANLKCITEAGKGALTGSAQDCLTADANGKLEDEAAKTFADEAKKCTDTPSFAYARAVAINAAGAGGRLLGFADLFGSSLDANIISCAANSDGCKCQRRVARIAEKLMRAKWKLFAKCKKAALAEATTAADIAKCVVDPVTAGSIAADPKQKLHAMVMKLSDLVAKKCDNSGVTAAAFANGRCSGLAGDALAVCIDERIECRACQTINVADGLAVDCDLFDDGLANGSCPEIVCDHTIPPGLLGFGSGQDACLCNSLGAAGQQGCDTGEKCAWVEIQDTPERLGNFDCVPDGVVGLGGACTHGAAGASTGYDDCAAGSACIGPNGNAFCMDICGVDNSPISACAAGEACARYADLGANDDDPIIGVCSPICDPLEQTRVVNGNTTNCGAGRGCYLVESATDTIAVCAQAGIPTHNMPIGGTTYANSCAPGHLPRQAVQGAAGNECAGLCKPADVYKDHNEIYEGGNSDATNWVNMPATCESAGGTTVLPSVPTTGESCSYYWTRESAGDLTSFSNTVGWCFNHANWKYDPDGMDPIDKTTSYPRCIVTTTGDTLPPVNLSMPHNDAIYFGCMQLPSMLGPAGADAVQRGEPKLDRLDSYR